MANAASASESTSASLRLHATMRSLGDISCGLPWQADGPARRDYSNSGAGWGRAVGRAEGRGQGRAVWAFSGTAAFAVMPGLVPLLSGLIFASGAKGLSTSGFPADRAGRGSDFGTPASPVAVLGLAPPSPTASCPDLFRASTLRHRGGRGRGRGGGGDVDARNKSGHDGWGRGWPEDARPARHRPRPWRTARAENLNRTAMDLFRASTWVRRYAGRRSCRHAARRGCPEQVRAWRKRCRGPPAGRVIYDKLQCFTRTPGLSTCAGRR